ncbi:MAG: DNA polymerase [Opitutales bacterium]|nr:DNA polymerase [Opitutales bacterium]MCH8540245.1 DNA polymerase [Opitutales bacterium]
MKGITGIWVDPKNGTLWTQTSVGAREGSFTPFLWVDDESALDLPTESKVVAGRGEGVFSRRIEFSHFAGYQEFLSAHRGYPGLCPVRNAESLALVSNGWRMFADLLLGDLNRCQLDIETASSEEGVFSNARRKGDRVLAIGLRLGGRDVLLELEEDSDAAEKRLLQDFSDFLRKEDPDTLEGHNIYRFDLDYLRQRAKRHGLPCDWGRFGQQAVFRSSRLKVAERWVGFPRCDLPGRTVVDTYLLVQLYDLANRDLTAYGLKTVARHFGITPADGAGRTYIEGGAIDRIFREDREAFRAYLKDDLRETEGVANQLLPTYFAQTKNFPMTLQEILLRGTSQKIDLLFLEKYFRADAAIPDFTNESVPFEGGYTIGSAEGVYRKVLHFDVASLYPSLLLALGQNPRADHLGVFLPTLRKLREYRLRYKKLARDEKDPLLQTEYAARQAAYKIIINSFYGYLGFANARFGDVKLAAKITRQGRELLQKLIEAFPQWGCRVLEADTDGLYVEAPDYWDNPGELLAKASALLPEGIQLECDGSYVSMFCYKAKNYALYDGENIIVRGSALRSRGTEPFLRELTNNLIAYHLRGPEAESVVDPQKAWEQVHGAVCAGDFPIEKLAKSENLSQSPVAYVRARESEGRKPPRRASLEAALKKEEKLRAGDRVTFFISTKPKASDPDWKYSQPIEHFAPLTCTYDVKTYEKKLKDWRKRYLPDARG